MKKIFILTLAAILSIAFTSCENDPIDEIPVKYPKLIFPEPYTVWGGTVANTREHMRKFGLDGSDLNQLDVEYLDGKLEHKWFQFYAGENLYDKSHSQIFYKYCFDSSEGGLKAIYIELNGYGTIKLDEITTQFKNAGYSYDGFIETKFHQYSNAATIVRYYVAESYLTYKANNDSDEIKWR